MPRSGVAHGLKTLHNYVINVHLHIMSHLIFEDIVDHPLEGCFSVL